MAARLRAHHDEQTRSKIQASQLINRLQAHVLGECEMTPAQVRSADILLKKIMPDLQAITLGGDPDNPVSTSLTVLLKRPEPPAE